MLVLAMVMVAAGAGVAAWALYGTRQIVSDAPTLIQRALGEASSEEEAGAPAPGLIYRAAEPLLRLGAGLMRRVSPARRVDLIRRRILYAGAEARLTVEKVLAYKAVAGLAGLAFGMAFSPGKLPSVLSGPAMGLLASFVPDLILDSRGKKRQAEIARDLPEALDLVAITVEAGLGLDQALEVVVENLPSALGDELTRLLREVGLGVSRRDALGGLRERTEVPELSALVAALIQADRMGMPISQVLRVQAEQVRAKRRARARERAGQTPVKILFPLILGIFPAIFVVTAGPGAIRIVDSLFR